MESRFTKAVRRHRIGRASVRHVMATITATGTTTDRGNPGWRYVGVDERDRGLEVIAVEVAEAASTYLLVVHVMPTALRGSGTDA